MTTHQAQVSQFTRDQYLNGKCSPAEYYAQFITPTGVELVQRSPIFQTLKNTEVKKLTDLPLLGWNGIGSASDACRLLNELGDHWSLATSVVINKRIAAHLLGIQS
jgi:hypothetical protein